MSTEPLEYIDKICHRCWGRGTVTDGPDASCGYGYWICPRCEGTGEEPPFRWWPIVALIVVLVVGLYLVWSIK